MEPTDLDLFMTKDEAVERWPDLEPIERERRRKLSIEAKKRHMEVADPDTGRRRFGGPQPGSGRPKKKRVAETIAERAQSDKGQKQIADALFSGLKKKNHPSIRVSTAKTIVDIEREERKLQLDEDEFTQKPKEELLDFLLPHLVDMTKRNELPDPRVSTDFDAEATVVEE